MGGNSKRFIENELNIDTGMPPMLEVFFMPEYVLKGNQ